MDAKEFVTVSPDDIDAETAAKAFYGTSFSPERRGQHYRETYAADVLKMAERFAPLAVTPEQQTLLRAETEQFRTRYRRAFVAYLSAEGRVFSTMIAGPSNFPAERMRKRSTTADRRIDELRELWEKAARSIGRRLEALKTPEMRQNEESRRLCMAVDNWLGHHGNTLIKQNLVGRLARAAKNGEVEAVEAALAHLAKVNATLARGKFTASHSVWSLSALARSVREKAEAAPTDAETLATFGDGVSVAREPEDDRVRIYFPGKPDEPIRAALRGEGWKWSPRSGAWQRKMTQAAEQSAQRILSRFFPTPA